MSEGQFAAIILAAGYSSRMGMFKPLLELGNGTVLDRTISTFKHRSISDIMVVAGHNHEAIRSHLTNQNVLLVENPDYQEGMFSSIQTGVARLSASTEAFFIMPVDIPLVQPATITNLVKAYKANPGHIIRPRYHERFGHPPLIPNKLINPILNSGGKGGLRELLIQHKDITINLKVPDRNILLDMDNQEDYLVIRKKSRTESSK